MEAIRKRKSANFLTADEAQANSRKRTRYIVPGTGRLPHKCIRKYILRHNFLKMTRNYVELQRYLTNATY